MVSWSKLHLEFPKREHFTVLFFSFPLLYAYFARIEVILSSCIRILPMFYHLYCVISNRCFHFLNKTSFFSESKVYQPWMVCDNLNILQPDRRGSGHWQALIIEVPKGSFLVIYWTFWIIPSNTTNYIPKKFIQNVVFVTIKWRQHYLFMPVSWNIVQVGLWSYIVLELCRAFPHAKLKFLTLNLHNIINTYILFSICVLVAYFLFVYLWSTRSLQRGSYIISLEVLSAIYSFGLICHGQCPRPRSFSVYLMAY